MWQANPILGVGGGNATYHIGRYQPTDFEEREYNERDWSGMAMHSFYFQLLPEHGVVGVALVAFLIWSHFRINRRLIRDVGRSRSVPPELRRDTLLYARALNGMLIAFLAAGTFLSVAYYPYLWYFTALAAALDLAVRRELPSRTARTSAPQPALP
jgi:putative inorganic carbon (HCO3(-)) transporter